LWAQTIHGTIEADDDSGSNSGGDDTGFCHERWCVKTADNKWCSDGVGVQQVKVRVKVKLVGARSILHPCQTCSGDHIILPWKPPVIIVLFVTRTTFAFTIHHDRLQMNSSNPRAGWERVGHQFYRKIQLYESIFDPDLELENYIVAGAPHGGAIGMPYPPTLRIR
jgi:hypothetical protein